MIVSSVREDEPTFGIVLDIFRTNVEETLFVMRKLCTLGLNSHYHAYEVVETSSIMVLVHQQFCDYHPLHICKSFSEGSCCFVSLKYHIVKV